MVKKLYGVCHGGRLMMMGAPVGEYDVFLSRELQAELESLPKGTRVGVEDLAELCVNSVREKDSLSVDGKDIQFSHACAGYWSHIEAICIERGYDIVFLDDAEVMRKHIRKLLEAEEMTEKTNRIAKAKMKKYEKFDDVPKDTQEKLLAMARESHALKTEAWYIHAIEREGRILERIAETKPDVVFAGTAHSDYFIANPAEMAKRGIVFESYAKEEEEVDLPILFGGTPGITRLVQNPIPNIAVLAQREQFIRKYNAVKLGRIFSDRKPDFIGTWDARVPANGLFEMFIEKREEGSEGTEIRGIIEDTIGHANFHGNITNGGITFYKSYTYPATALGGDGQLLFYEGKLEGAEYKGQYAYMETGSKRHFTMRRFAV